MKTKITLSIAIFMVTLTIVLSQPIFPLMAYEENPALEVTHTWEYGGLMFPFVYYENDTFYLFYTGGDMTTGPTSIGVATSTDGYGFTQFENPIFEGDGSGIDAYSVAFPVVFKKEGTYYLFYVGASGPGLCSEGVIMQAMASNIYGPYERLADPIMEPGSAGEWDAAGVAPDRVFDSDSGLVMYFTGTIYGFSPHQEGFAHFNGSEWIKYDDPVTTDPPYAESDPVLKEGTPPEWDAWCASMVDVNQIDSGWELFYQGQYNNNWKIGYATSSDGIEWTKMEDPVYSWADDLFAQLWGFSITASPTMVVVDNKYYIYYDYGNCYNYLGMATAWSIHALDVLADPADNIGGYGFTANWQASEIATGYLLDVSTQEDFGTFVSGYQNFDVGNETSFDVTQLNLNTMHYYRLRAYMETDTGFYSNTVSTTTLITGFSNSLENEIAIYTSGSDIYINLSVKNNTEANARIYTLSGKMLDSYNLVEGKNTIPLHIEKQLVIIKVRIGNQTFTKKVLVW